MTNEELCELIQQGKTEYTEDLYKQNLTIIRMYVKPYADSGDLADAMQESFFPCVTAALEFDAQKGCKFTSFLKWRVIGHIQKYAQESALIRTPRHLYEEKHRYGKTVAQFYKEHGRTPTPDEITELTGLSKRKQDKIVSLLHETTSLNEAFEMDDSGVSDEMLDFLPSDTDVEGDVVEDSFKEQMRCDVDEMLENHLDDRQREIVRRSIMGNTPLSVLANEQGVSKERIRQIQESALRRLRVQCEQLLNEYAKVEGLSFRGCGVTTFKETWTSSTERAAIHLLDYDLRYEEILRKWDESNRNYA